MVDIGTKQGVTYHCECRDMNSIINPKVDNNTNMRFTGFFDKNWDEYDVDFDAFGYGLKKTRTNKGVILCDDATQCFNTTRGYVSLSLSFPYNIVNGIHGSILSETAFSNEFLLWGINVGNFLPSYPSAYVKFTTNGIEFTIWTIFGKFTIIDSFSNITANSRNLFEFLWDSNTLDNFDLNDYDATMSIRINGEDVATGNYPIGDMEIEGLNLCILDTPFINSNLECTISKIVLGNEVPRDIEKEWQSSSSENIGDFFYEDLSLNKILNEDTIHFASYNNIDIVNGELQLTTNKRSFGRILIPNTNDGTLSRVDVFDETTPVEIGRYYLSDTILSQPSRSVVTASGDCWVANRNYGTIIKIGSMENSHCMNSCSPTSDGKYILPFGDDDVLLCYFDISAEKIKYGSDHDYPSNTISVYGIANDVNDNVWIESGYNSGKAGTWFLIEPGNAVTKYSNITGGSYAACCSLKNNYIWSVRYPTMDGIDFFSADDPENTSKTLNNVFTYGIKYSRGYIYIGDYLSSLDSTTRRVIRINEDYAIDSDNYPLYATTFSFSNCPIANYFPANFEVILNDDGTEDLYIGWYALGLVSSGYLSVIRNHKQYADGSKIDIDFSTCEKYALNTKSVSGLSICYNNKNKPIIWILNRDSINIQAFNPITKTFITFSNDLTSYPIGETMHFSDSNFSGTVIEDNLPTVKGIAIYIVDGRIDSTVWKRICADIDVSAESFLNIMASASDDPNVFGKAISITNCINVPSGPEFVGRYLRIIFDLNRNSTSDLSPKIKDINVEFWE